MKLACITFTSAGNEIAERIKSSFTADIYGKDAYKEKLGDIFAQYSHIVFIASTGIAVRLSAPYLSGKAVDPAVVVVDDLGRYAISLLSGHLGGANELALRLAEVLGCRPVITTASDGRGIEAVDVFAKRNGLVIESLEAAKQITAMMLEHKKVRLRSEVNLQLGYDNLVEADYEAEILVSSRLGISSEKPCCILRPKNINIGIGCRRGKTKTEVLAAINEVFERSGLSRKSIRAAATVDVKSDEAGIIEAFNEIGCSLQIFDRDSIGKVQDLYAGSDFVRSIIGVSSVCEPCACLLGGRLIVPKTAVNGITIALAKEE